MSEIVGFSNIEVGYGINDIFGEFKVYTTNGEKPEEFPMRIYYSKKMKTLRFVDVFDIDGEEIIPYTMIKDFVNILKSRGLEVL